MKRELHLFEIILISCGNVTVLYSSCVHRDVAKKYISLMEHGHKFIRIRKDGVNLTIHESDLFANQYHPRTRKGKAAV